MRLRNVRDAFERIHNFKAVVREPEQYRGRWSEFFGNNNPIHIEIGMGMGQFLRGHAWRNPDINYIGLEKFTVVLVKAMERIVNEKEPLGNLRVVRFDAEHILNLFEENEVDCIYLNFSDPWPKDRHYKRRLTYREFLIKYRQVMKPEGKVIFKTDNDGLFEFSLGEMEAVGMTFEKLTRDLHNSEFSDGNIMTEYEEKFHSLGENIHMVQAIFK